MGSICSSTYVRIALGAAVCLGCGDGGTPPVTVAAVELSTGEGQARYPGTPLTGPIRIQAVSADGTPVERAGLPVEWMVIGGGGSVEGEMETDSRGRAGVIWTLGSSLGEQHLKVRVAGSSPLQVTARAVEPGPIVFSRMRTDGAFGSLGIYTMNPDGSDAAAAAAGDGWSPVWAPEGSAIVFVRDLQSTSQLFRISTDGWITSQITSEPAPDSRGLLHIDPSFSPDGSRIVYNVKQGHADCGNIAWTQIYVANADGNGATRLTDGCGLANSQASFSPAGDRIAYRSKRDEASAGIPSFPMFSIFVMDADGSNQVRLTPLKSSEDEPVWAPDGSRIYFTKNHREVWAVRPDGSASELLWALDLPAFATTGVSPDGTRLLLDIFGTGEAFEVATLDLATGAVTIIADRAYDSSWRR